MENNKSSNEILTELFGAFNAEPPKASLNTVADNAKSEKKHKKSKKSKKKHKSKKRKKDKGVDSNSDNSSHKKRKKNANIDSDSDCNSRKKRKVTKVEVPVEALPLALDILLDGINPPRPNGTDDIEAMLPMLPPLQPEEVNFTVGDIPEPEEPSTKPDEIDDGVKSIAFEEPPPDSKDEKKKGKIQIINLKNSAVFKETIRAVEEKQKEEAEKKAKYEDGEISDSDSSKQEANDEDEFKTSSKVSIHKQRSSKSRSQSTKDKKRSKRSRSGSPHHGSSRSSYHSSRSHRHPSHSSRERPSYPDRSDLRSSDRHGSHTSRVRNRSRELHRSTAAGSSKDRPSRSHSSPKEKEKRKTRSRSKSTERGIGKEKIDKQKLLAIARKNALKLIDAGIVPGSDKLIKSGGKTVSELTEYCKKLSKKEADGGDLSDIISGSSGDEDTAFHHPFQVRDRPNSIVMNIRNATPLPVRSLQEKAAEQSKQLRLQFPVSSGTSHRVTGSEWTPVEAKKEPPKAIMPPLPPPKPTPPLSMPPMPPAALQFAGDFPPDLPPLSKPLSAVPPPLPAAPPVFPVIQPSASDSSRSSNSGSKIESLDISAIVSKRLNAMRKLQENPHDKRAITDMNRAQTEMQIWSEQRTELGAFTGSTGARMLSAAELSSGTQAWAKKDQLIAARPVKGGMGMALLQKMGWKPGEGLGRNKEGTLEPLKLEIKTDKKGLVATDEAWRMKGKSGNQVGPPLPTVKTLDGKHPVSLLNEYCNKRKWGQPTFDLAFECGPDHKKNFLFKVSVNGKEYKPSVASANKKQAKAEAAAICLRALGLMTGDIVETP